MTAAFRTALQAAFPAVDVEPVVTATNNPKFGDYQCNNAMQLFGRLKGKAWPSSLAESGPVLWGCCPLSYRARRMCWPQPP